MGEIINRMRQIKENRKKFVKELEAGDIIVDSKFFMGLVKNFENSIGKYIWSDNPNCALLGISDVCRTFYCKIEDLSEKQIKKIDNLKFN